MFTLNELSKSHRHILFLDAASSRIQIGLARDSDMSWGASQDEAGVSVFAMTHQLLTGASLKVRDIDAFVFCDGPGSVLGIRTTAVALRTWCALRQRPCYSYGSLNLVAHFELQSSRARPFSVIADARRETWHSVDVTNTEPSSLVRRAVADVRSAAVMPEHFRTWSQPPAGLQIVPYEVGQMFSVLRHQPLFRETASPDAFLHEEPVYQTWDPKIHQAAPR